MAETWWAQAREQGDMEGVIIARRWLARCSADQGDVKQARCPIEAAIEVSKTHPVHLTDWRSYALLHELARRAGDDPSAQLAQNEARARLNALAEQLDDPAQRERLQSLGEHVLRAGLHR